VNLISFHRFLIACAIFFCAGFAGWELHRYYGNPKGSGTLALAIVFGALAAALAVYLVRLNAFLGHPPRSD
jgi:hypothetical protein